MSNIAPTPVSPNDVDLLRGQVETLAKRLNDASQAQALLQDELTATKKQLALRCAEIDVANRTIAEYHERIAELLFEITETSP